ncbi:MAG TPA: glutamine amidotransferase, partial [Planctomycetota bacterium]|nr:glutamine amidotransferase [Planctomycetota bacterium]
EKGIPVGLGVPGPTLKEFGQKFPDVFAFVVTQPKQRAELQLYTVVEGEKLPILASWHYGLGKSVAFTSDCTNRWGAKWVEWPSYRKFWVNLFTWVSRQRMPSQHTVTTRVEGDKARVIVEGVDAKGEYLNFAKLTGNAIDPQVARTGEGENFVLNFTMTAPGRYEATFPIQKAGAYSVTVIDQSDPKKPNTIVTGVANSYSPEFLHLEGDEALMTKLGEIATGKNEVSRLKDLSKLEKTDPKELGLWAHDLPPARQPTDLFWALLLIALCLFPLDVAVRRLALDPEVAAKWAAERMSPALAALKIKKAQLQDAATEALAGEQAAPPPPQEIVPSGANSRAAQSRYEQAGGSAEAQGMDLNPSADPKANKPVVGGTKVSQADEAASDYTRALLKAKKRAKKD